MPESEDKKNNRDRNRKRFEGIPAKRGVKPPSVPLPRNPNDPKAPRKVAGDAASPPTGMSVAEPADRHVQHPQDLVWNAITDSAKARFDYHAFERVFSDMGNPHVAENVLFHTIVGHAVGDSTDKIVADINLEFLSLGMGLSEEWFRSFVTEKKKELEGEILAADIAMALFEQGAKPPEVLVQVQKILGAG